MSERVVKKLESRDIKPTPNRLLVLEAVMSSSAPVSLADLEAILGTVDKSSIFRTLTQFLSHHLIHGVDDGTGSFKYAVCSPDCSCEVEDLHTHFHCEGCNRTFCMKNIPTPVVQLPEGFTLNSINYVLKGLCPECAAKGKKA